MGLWNKLFGTKKSKKKTSSKKTTAKGSKKKTSNSRNSKKTSSQKSSTKKNTPLKKNSANAQYKQFKKDYGIKNTKESGTNKKTYNKNTPLANQNGTNASKYLSAYNAGKGRKTGSNNTKVWKTLTSQDAAQNQAQGFGKAKKTSGVRNKNKGEIAAQNMAEAMAENRKNADSDRKSAKKAAKTYRNSAEYVKDYRKSYADATREYLKEQGWSKNRINEYLKSDEYKAGRKSYYKTDYTKDVSVDKMAENILQDTQKQRMKDAKAQTEVENKAINGKGKILKQDDYTKMATWAQQGQLQQNIKADNIASEKGKGSGIGKRLAEQNVKDYVNSAGVMGALDQMTQGLSVSTDTNTYKYTDAQKAAMDKAKKQGSYTLGRVVGGAAEFALGGTNAIGKNIASTALKTAGKAALKEAAEQGGKQLTKTVAKNALKEGAADIAASMPLNTLDALKDSYVNGKIDKATFTKSLLQNVALDAVLGGGTSAIGAKMTKKQISAFSNIDKKIKAGETVTAAERDFYTKVANEIANEEAAKLAPTIKKNKEAKAKVDQVVTQARANAKDRAEIKSTSEKTFDREARDSEILRAMNEDEEYYKKYSVEEVENDPAFINSIYDEAFRKLETAGKNESVINYGDVKIVHQADGTYYMAVGNRHKIGTKEEAEELLDRLRNAKLDGAEKNTPRKLRTSSLTENEVAKINELETKLGTLNKESGQRSRSLVDNKYKDYDKYMSEQSKLGTEITRITREIDDIKKYEPTEKQPISATTKATDTTAPKVEESPSTAKLTGSEAKYKELTEEHDALIPEYESLTKEIENAKKAGDVPDELMARYENVTNEMNRLTDEANAYRQKMFDEAGIEVTPEVKKQIADEVEAEAKAIDEEIAAEKEIADEVKAETEEIEKQTAREPASINVKNESPAESFDTLADKQDYRAEAEKVMQKNPEMGQNAAKQSVLYYDTEELEQAFFDAFDDNLFRKSSKVTQEEARGIVKDMEKSTSLTDMANQFLGRDVTTDPHVFGAMARNLIGRLRAEYKATGSADTLELLIKVSDHANGTVSQGASFTNAAKMWVSLSETGRVNAMNRLVDRLNAQNADRLKKPLELTEEQKGLMMKAETDEEVAEAIATIEGQLRNQIPSTFWEKVNTLRHLSMLGNLRTNIRNLGGNGAMAGARAISDGIEYGVTKAARKLFEKEGVDAIRSTTGFATKEEKSVAIPFIEKEFDKFYDANSSRYKDILEGTEVKDTVLDSKLGKGFEKFVYACLEKGDMAFFKPEYKRNYIRWVKHNIAKNEKGEIQKITAEMLDGMTDAEKSSANKYAMSMAERATFRDTTAASKMLTKLKVKTATKQGKTIYGTAAYRLANVALESAVPFVKTPINVFRQSIDYSPIGIVKAFGEFATYAKRGDVDLLEQSIHHFATGLTGGGITYFGYMLAENGFIQVKAGEKSGDAYYDRDMGYQDYSLVMKLPNGKEYSFTIDWASPLQSSLFMGAQIFRNLEENGITGMDARDIINAFSSLLVPHLEASFMSGTADALEMFAQTAYSTSAKQAKNQNYNSGADWGGAILKTFGGTIPQNFVATLLPFSQLSSQIAGGLDPYQRDTSSTAEDPLVNSWQSFFRKMENRIPIVREGLNTKLDRRGNDVKSSPISNPVLKMINALANPSTVKEITFDKTDKELIDIYKNMPDGTTEEKNAKKYFFYNFTGKPSYDLEGDKEGQRMTYKEAHEYLVSSRKEQNNCIQDMLNAKSYKNMTYGMKADEVNSSYWISKAVADMETYSAKYACSALNRSSDKDAWKAYSLGNGSAKKFMDFYITKEKLIARAHDSGYNTKALAVVMANDKSITKLAKGAYNIYKSKLETAQAYVDAGGNFKEYTDASCNIMSKINKANTDKYPVTDSNSNKGVAAAYYKINKRTYAGLGLTADKANMGYWFKNNTDADGNKYTLRSLSALKAQGEAEGYDLGTKAGVTEYIESIGENMSQVEKACVFEYLDQHNSNNPYGAIPNYLGLKDSSSGGGGGGWGHGGWGHGGGGGGSSSTAPNEYKEYSYKKVSVKSGSSGTARNAFKTAAPTPGSSSVKKAKSGIDDAYKRKLQKYIDNLR